MIKTIFCDLGNVLLDFDPGRVARNVMNCCRIDVSDRLEEFFLTALRPFESGLCDTAGFLRATKGLFPELAGMDGAFIADLFSDIFIKNEENIRFITQLAPSHTLIMVSNTNPMHIDYLLSFAPEAFAPFDAFVYSYEVGAMQPDERMFTEALRRSRAQVSETIFIDDREENIAAASALGMNVCHYTGARPLSELLASAGLTGAADLTTIVS
jgi:HAD superfamily hydrolase (TIGR01509 family)